VSGCISGKVGSVIWYSNSMVVATLKLRNHTEFTLI